MKTRKNADICSVEIPMPENIENLHLPNPDLLTFYKNLDNRILWIDDDISEFSIEYAKYIIQWNKEDLKKRNKKPIKLLFFSYGGDLQVNSMLQDVITMSKVPVIGINCGMAASAACFIYLACHERYTFPRAEFLIHQGAGEFGGTYENVMSAIMNYQREIEELGNYILSRTSIPKEIFDANFSTDWYLTAEEAVEYGLCSKIITSLDELLK